MFQTLLAGLFFQMPPTIPVQDDWSDHPAWSGSWKVSAPLTQKLGFEIKPDSPVGQRISISFFISKNAAMAVAGKETINQALTQIEKWKVPGKHQVLAAGKIFQQDDKENGQLCIVTVASGKTFLWIGDQQAMTIAAEAQHIRGNTAGKNRELDLLFLDFSGILAGRSKYLQKNGTPLFTVVAYERPQPK